MLSHTLKLKPRVDRAASENTCDHAAFFSRSLAGFISWAIYFWDGFCQSKTTLFASRCFRLDSRYPSSYRHLSQFYRFLWSSFLRLVSASTAVWQAKIGWQLCASRVLRKQRVLRSRRTFVHKQVGGIGLRWMPIKTAFVVLHSAESRHSYSRRRRCWRNGIDNTRCCRHVIHAAGKRS